jgi:LysM repeat protein
LCRRAAVAIGTGVVLPAVVAGAAAASTSYVVQPGDTLSAISRRYGVSASALATANGLANPHLIVAGRRLVIPTGGTGGATPTATTTAKAPATTAATAATTAKAPATAAKPATAPGTATKYTVRRGDSFIAIGRRYGLLPADVAKANQLTLDALIVPGQVLTIPARSLPPGTPPNLPSDLTSDPNRLALVPVFRAAAAEFGVPADLLMAQAYRESRWQSQAVSPTGAMGIGQLLPSTAGYLAGVLMGEPTLSAWKPADNIRMSARFMKFMLDRYKGDQDGTLAAYYQGSVSYERDGVTPAGKAYADSVKALRPQFQG